MYVRDETDFHILRRAEDILQRPFNWNVKDDEMTGWCNEDEIAIIDDLCDIIDKLKGEKNG